MSAFIVISVKDSLNWIVDGIKDGRPHNPNVITHLSTGKIKKAEEGKYLYEYTTYSKHAGGGADEALEKTVESDIPRNLFKNQIAQFLNVCENEGEQINIFLLDNPITVDDFEQSSWLIDEIRSVYESHFATNFQLVRVLFSYQIDKPTDVTRQVSRMVLKQLTELNLCDTDDFLTRILYVDNQNRNGAAICLDKNGHDIMLPRMLCDLMMLLSNKDDSYNTAAAINGETRMFAVGYSECMYYHDDIFKYYSLAGNRDLMSYILDDKNDCTSLDYQREPFGLSDRQKRLGAKYDEVPFESNIHSAPDSIDKEINDILIFFKDDLIDIRERALKDAEEADRLATEQARKEKLNEILATEREKKETESAEINADHEPYANTDERKEYKGCYFLARLFHSNKDKDAETPQTDEDTVDPRVKDIVIKTEFEKASKEYPEFIDREEIFKQFTLQKDEGFLYDGVPFDQNVAAYRSLIKFIRSDKFKRFLKNKVTTLALQPEEDSSRDKSRKKNNTSKMPVSSSVSWLELLAKIKTIDVLIKERQEYNELCTKVLEIKAELEQVKQEVKNYRLTTHCSSVDNLIDLDKLEEFHLRGRDKRITEVVKHWKERKEETRLIESLQDDLAEITKWEVFDFYYIKWDDPFDFIKDIDLNNVCKHLKAKSQPFVNTYTLDPNAENLTSYYYYTDNARWNEGIQNGRVGLNDTNKVGSTLSSHICSKICMFQFLPMSKALIEGLVDCYEQ